MYEVNICTSGVSPGNTGQIGMVIGSKSSLQEQKSRKSLFPQCKTSIGHNSISIKHGAMRFACSIGFLDMADRMVWPPSLSRDRKWPRVTECTHSRVIGLRLEGSLVLRRVWQLGAILYTSRSIRFSAPPVRHRQMIGNINDFVWYFVNASSNVV